MKNCCYETSFAQAVYDGYVYEANQTEAALHFLSHRLSVLTDPDSFPAEHHQLTSQIEDLITDTLVTTSSWALFVDCNLVVDILIAQLKKDCYTGRDATP